MELKNRPKQTDQTKKIYSEKNRPIKTDLQNKKTEPTKCLKTDQKNRTKPTTKNTKIKSPQNPLKDGQKREESKTTLKHR